LYLPLLHITLNLLELVFYTRLIPNMSRTSLFISFDWVRIMTVLMRRQSLIQTLLFIVSNSIDFIIRAIIRCNCDQKLSISIKYHEKLTRLIILIEKYTYILLVIYMSLLIYCYCKGFLMGKSIDKIEFTAKFWRIDTVSGTSLNLIK